MNIKFWLLLIGVTLAQGQVYELFQEMVQPRSTNYQVALSAHSGVMAIGSNDGGLHVYFNNGSKFVNHQSYSFGRYVILPTDITPDGKWIAVAGYTPDFQTRVGVYRFEPADNTYKQFYNFYNEKTGAYGVAISNDHQWMFSGHGETLEMQVFKFIGETFVPHSVLKVAGPTTSLDLTDDNNFLAVGLKTLSVAIFKFNGGGYELFQEIQFDQFEIIRRVSITGDGKCLVVAHTLLSFVEIYEFNETSQLFELVQVNGSLVFTGEVVTHSEFNEAKSMLGVSTDKASYIFSYDNGSIH